MPSKDLLLTVQRQVIAVLAHNNVCEQPCSGTSALNNLGFRREFAGNHSVFAARAGALDADVFSHEKASRCIFQLFRDFFADFSHLDAAALAGFLLRLVFYPLTREFGGSGFRPPRRR